MKITLKEDHHTCADGCCDNYGYEVFVDKTSIGYIDDYDVERLVQLLNVWFNRLPKEASN
jgi:hypothetical protein